MVARPPAAHWQGIGLLVPHERALARLLAIARPVEPRSLPVEAAAGRVLAGAVQSSGPIPANSVALRGGWAVAAADVVGASYYSPVMLGAGAAPVEVGQAMPIGADAVLPPDAVTVTHGAFEIVAEAASGEDVRRAGEDAAPGAVLRDRGERLRPSDVAVALAAGVRSVSVREPRLRILSSASPGSVDVAGEIVARLAEAAGAAIDQIGIGGDAAGIAAALRNPGADLAVVVAAGIGSDDPAAEALASIGEMTARGIALRPGEVSGCGAVGPMPVILVPGRVEGALAAALTLVLPCLDHLMGAATPRPTLSGALTRKISSTVGMTDIVLLRRHRAGLEPLAAGDITLTAIAGAEAWLAVHADSEGFAAGETVTAFVL